jgi:hypothetical protein
MKTFLFILVLAAVVWVACQKKEPHPTVMADGASSVRDRAQEVLRTAADQTRATAATLAEKSREVAGTVKEDWDRKRVEWRLTDSDIRTDLDKTGVLIREKTGVAGEKLGAAMDNARVVTVINSKLVADPDLSALKIDVDADHGVVTLKGTVKSLELVARATALALETQGVTQVISMLSVEA